MNYLGLIAAQRSVEAHDLTIAVCVRPKRQ